MAEYESGSDNLTSSFTDGSDIVYDIVCDACVGDGKHIEAEGFCLECCDYLCNGCIQAHAKNRASKNHVIQSKSQMPRQKPSALLPKSTTGFTTKCDHHPDRLIEYFCRDDGNLGCTVCMTVKHRQCKGVDHLSDISNHLLDSHEYQQVTSSLASLKTQSRNIIETSKNNTTQANNVCTDVDTALHDLRRKEAEAFDKLDLDVKKKATSIKTADMGKLKAIGDKGTDVLDEVEKISEELETLKDKNQLGELFVRIIKLEDRLQALQALLDEADADNIVTTYTFKPGSRIQDILDDPSSIGKLSVHAPVAKQRASQKKTASSMKPASEGQRHQQLHPNPSSATAIQPPILKPSIAIPDHQKRPAAGNVTSSAPPLRMTSDDVTATKIADIRIKIKDDNNSSNITGSAMLSDKKLILVDGANSKIKLLNMPTSEVTSYLKVLGPYDVASVSHDQVAITIPRAAKIAFVKVASTMTMDRELDVNGTCRSILHNNGSLVVSFCEPNKIEIMTLDGTVNKIIDCSGMFRWSPYIALSRAHDAIYLTDSFGDNLKRINLDGVIEIEFKDRNLKDPASVIVDQHDRVIICGAGSGNIHLLTHDLTKKKLLIDGLITPRSLSFCHSNSRLYIASDDDDVLSVYQLL